MGSTEEGRQAVYKLGGCLFSVFMLLIVILLPMSYSTIEYYQIGFVQRRTTGTVDRSEVYGPGKYMLGPDYGFVVFPSSIQNVDVQDVAAWTKSGDEDAGTSIEMDISYQYQLIPDQLPQLFDKRNTVFRPFIENLAMSTIKDTATNFSADAFLQNRHQIEKEMVIQITKSLRAANTDLKGFQMRRVDFPDTYVRMKLDAATQQLMNGAAEYSQQAEVTRTETVKQVKLKTNQALQLQEVALAEASRIRESAKVKAVDLGQTARNQGLLKLSTELGIAAMKDGDGKLTAAGGKHFLALDYLINIADAADGTKTYVDFSTLLASNK